MSQPVNQHPFQWHVTRVSNLEPAEYVLFSRLRGWDKARYLILEQAIVVRDDLNNLEKWEEWYTPDQVEKLIREEVVYSEQTLKSLWVED